MIPFNRKFRTKYFFNGGLVKKHKNMTKKHMINDSIKAILQPNEIVIPVKHAKTVSKLLRQNNIKLPGV